MNLSYVVMKLIDPPYKLTLPELFHDLAAFAFHPSDDHFRAAEKIAALFPLTANNPLLKGGRGKSSFCALRVGALFSGGPAPGGHNVLAGLLDALKAMHPEARLFGFLDGPEGAIAGKYKELTSEVLAPYRNQGGFDCIGTGRTKIETQEQLQAIKNVIESLKLDGIVIIGGDDSNTNAAVLAEFLLQQGCACRVIGVPKTIDGDLKNPYVPISFGFDTACKIYAELIGNLARDLLSAKNGYHFIRLMGRSASHITLECALATHPNLAFISEEVAREKKKFAKLVEEMADLIMLRADLGKNYGIILIPEGLIECASELPKEIKTELQLPTDSHGNVQLSAVETERLCIQMVEAELKRRQFTKNFKGIPHFFGYEGRSGVPSHFDATYCYALGYGAALCVASKLTGYMCALQGLKQPADTWQVAAVPLTALMHLTTRQGKEKAVIEKGLVDLDGAAFMHFKNQRKRWALEDAYRFPGPIQFFGPSSNALPLSLQLEAHA